jgi:chemotaxis protein methyltransferase CheR
VELSRSSNRILASLLEAHTGQQLTMNRWWRIETALASMMRERGLATLDELVSRLLSGAEPGLREALVEALLNNETYFFRDRLPFDLLVAGPLRSLEKARAREKRLSIWCAGCSTGQEAYSLAMIFAEDKLRWRDWKIDIVGTDVSATAIEQSRQGLYSQFEVQRGLSVTQMLRWFGQEQKDWRISPELRSAIRFEQRSLFDPPPRPGRFDIILCRNLFLYFSPERRTTGFGQLAAALAEDGALMLGAGETVIGQTDRFDSDPACRGLYKPTHPCGPRQRLPRRA